MSEKLKIPFLLTAGAAAIAYGMIRGNNYVFIPGIIMAAAGYCLIRKEMKGAAGGEHDPDNPGIHSSDED